MCFCFNYLISWNFFGDKKCESQFALAQKYPLRVLVKPQKMFHTLKEITAAI